ncbi:hypothetical protein [Actinomycetospora chlora]|uniref:hypothetical protein n=1 Tax=Actinomycetospora chlora TaxID=663608 RepID=UPI0031EC26B4
MSGLAIVVDDLAGPEVAALLAEHLDDMRASSPPESTHALGLEALRRSDVTFWTVWDDHVLLGFGALRELDPSHGETSRCGRRPRTRASAWGRRWSGTSSRRRPGAATGG